MVRGVYNQSARRRLASAAVPDSAGPSPGSRTARTSVGPDGPVAAGGATAVVRPEPPLSWGCANRVGARQAAPLKFAPSRTLPRSRPPGGLISCRSTCSGAAQSQELTRVGPPGSACRPGHVPSPWRGRARRRRWPAAQTGSGVTRRPPLRRSPPGRPSRAPPRRPRVSPLRRRPPGDARRPARPAGSPCRAGGRRTPPRRSGPAGRLAQLRA